MARSWSTTVATRAEIETTNTVTRTETGYSTGDNPVFYLNLAKLIWPIPPHNGWIQALLHQRCELSVP